MTRISKKLKNPALKALTKLVKAVCEFEGQIMWDIILNPYNPHNKNIEYKEQMGLHIHYTGDAELPLS